MRWIITSIIIVACTEIMIAQSTIDRNKKTVEDAIENSAEEINESGQTEFPEELISLINYPLDLNTDNLEIFVTYNLITPAQLKALEDYKRISGKLIELQELQQINSFDKKSILNILPYSSVKSAKVESVSHQFTMRFQKRLYETVEKYPGSTWKMLFRLKSTLSSPLTLSFTGEKDDGEEIFSQRKKGFDFNSFNITYKGKSLLKKVIVGDYNIEFGQGLTAWTGLSFSSGNNITGIYKHGRGIIPYSGTDENRFFRGIALSFQKRKLRCDSWFSYHAIDGNKFTDTIADTEYVTSHQTSGYHRTDSEINDFHSQHETSYGTAITFTSGKTVIGLTVSGQQYKLPLNKSDQPYTRFEFSGKSNFTAGLNYSYTFKNILFFGETGYDRNSIAYLNGILMTIDPRLSLGFLNRSYPVKFIALKSDAFGKNSENRNETGTYFGINYKIIRELIYSAYSDIHSFQFLKYRVDKPSHGIDFFHQLEYIPVRKFTINFRYRKKFKQLNDQSEIAGLKNISDFTTDNYRLSARFKIDETWEYGFRVEYSKENKNKIQVGSGSMVSQDLFFHPMGKSYSFNFRYAIFNCPEFDTRIYEYENDVQGAFSVPFYYGNGSRFYTNINYKINRSISISLRYSISLVDDDEVTSEKSEIKMQIKLVFR